MNKNFIKEPEEPRIQNNLEDTVRMWRAYIQEIKRTEGLKRLRLLMLLSASIISTIAMLLGLIFDLLQ